MSWEGTQIEFVCGTKSDEDIPESVYLGEELSWFERCGSTIKLCFGLTAAITAVAALQYYIQGE